MNDGLDDDLRALRDEPPGGAYDQLETRVWRSIEEVRQARRAAPAVLAARTAAVVGALGLGVVGGGATAVAVAAEVQEISVFSVRTELAPSTLLDDHG